MGGDVADGPGESPLTQFGDTFVWLCNVPPEDWLEPSQSRRRNIPLLGQDAAPQDPASGCEPAARQPTRVWTIALVSEALVPDARIDVGELIKGVQTERIDDPRTRGDARELIDAIADPKWVLSFNEYRIATSKGAGPALVAKARELAREDSRAPRCAKEPEKGRGHRKPMGVVRFPTLFRLETAYFSQKDPSGDRGHVPALDVPPPLTTREPRVAFPGRDYFGLALSGGGIRSATFNLGLLQALQENGALNHVDYLSTASGGGYIGGFWTAWRHRNHDDKARGELFPECRLDDPRNALREHQAIRHLREFSRFLMPRVGFSQSETWSGIVAFLGGLSMSLLATVAGVATIFYAWLLLSSWLAGPDGPAQSHPTRMWRAAGFAALTLVWHGLAQRRLVQLGKLGDTPVVDWAIGVLICSVVALAFASWPLPDGVVRAFPSCARPFAMLLAPSIAWTGIGAVLLAARGLVARPLRRSSLLPWRTALDVTISRCLGSALVAACFTGIWWAATWASFSPCHSSAPSRAQAVGVATTGATLLFLWLRGWLQKPAENTPASYVLGVALKTLRPHVVQVVATIAVVLMGICIAMGLQRGGPALQTWAHPALPSLVSPLCGWLHKTMPRQIVDLTSVSATVIDWSRHGLSCALAVLAFGGALVMFDPASGLHEFYRARIARCFLGAAREQTLDPSTRPPAATFEQPADDIWLHELRRDPCRPIHLICCTANNLSGDVLGNLYRGGRSAVISPFGISVGDSSAALDELTLSAAMTASGAAFNSQMGELSMQYGPAVAFLMCALNLRLGLWVPHPLRAATGKRLWLSGWYFFEEALGISRSDQVWRPKQSSDADQRPSSRRAMLHLSDGGHFENLALYELVRRHCRYVIVSDVGADPDFMFDDLGRAVRLVREDFGVEIELDVSPLRGGADGLSAQHAVVGTIHYDGLDGSDKGLLIYFKPTMTGDEPVDLLHQRARAPRFPHDTTLNQFYDAAQWESYRRLGKHAASVVLSTSNRDLRPDSPDFADRLFQQANLRWPPGKRQSDDVHLDLAARWASLEKDVRESAPAALKCELFPEIADASGNPKALTRPAPNPDDAESVVYFLITAIQVMEDTWLGADLDSSWSHPLSEGWMNSFHRWASAPSFRTWWPVLAPMFAARFRDFVNERFDLALAEADRVGSGASLVVSPIVEDAFAGLAARQWRQHHTTDDRRKKRLECRLHLGGAMSMSPIQVGILLYDEIHDPLAGAVARWMMADLFVPAGLSGGGFTGRFLDGIIAYFKKESFAGLVADLSLPGQVGASTRAPFLAPARRAERVQRIAFYKSRGFDALDRTRPQVLTRTL